MGCCHSTASSAATPRSTGKSSSALDFDSILGRVYPVPEAALAYIGCRVNEAGDYPTGAWYDTKNKAWFEDSTVDTGFGPGNTKATQHRRQDNVVFDVPAGYAVDENFRGCSQTMKIGIWDDRTETLCAEGQFKVVFNNSGQLNAGTMARLRTALSSGKGRVCYEYFLPCLRVRTTLKAHECTYSWIHGVIVGAQIRGFLNANNMDDDEEEIEGGVGVDLNGEEGTLSAGARCAYSDINSGMVLSGDFEGHGGKEVYPAKWIQKPLTELYKHIDTEWRPQTMKAPRTWVVQRFMVKEAISDFEAEQRAMATRIHAVAVGRMGVGKSKFLTAFANGEKDACDYDLFKSAGADSDGMKSVTQQIESKTASIDYQHGAISTLLTDVPGFGDSRMHFDDENMQNLLAHVMAPGKENIHAVVFVEKWSTQRFDATHENFLKALADNFGDKLWQHLVIVLTNFALVDSEGTDLMCDDEVKNEAKAYEILEEKKLQWKRELQKWFKGAGRSLGENKNMLFAVDSNALIDNKDGDFICMFSKKQLGNLKKYLAARSCAKNYLRIKREDLPVRKSSSCSSSCSTLSPRVSEADEPDQMSWVAPESSALHSRPTRTSAPGVRLSEA